jgi:hypothetical protein
MVDVVSNNKVLYATRFCVNWAFLINGINNYITTVCVDLSSFVKIS